MNKIEYLDVLKDYLLKSYSEEESLDILRDYEEYFLNGKLDGKTESEIILELGSPKKIVQELKMEDREFVKKDGIFSGLSRKFDNWFENGLSSQNGSMGILENKADKFFEKYGIFAFMFFAIFSVFQIMLGLRFSVGLTIMLGIFTISMSFLVRTNKGFDTKQGRFLTIINILFIMFYLFLALKGTLDILEIGFSFSFWLAIINLIMISIFSKGMFFLMIISLIFAMLLILLGGIWFFFVVITVTGVGVAIFLTPITLTALSSLSLSFLWIIFPIMLAIGLFMMMCIVIKYYSIAIYRMVLNYNNWIKTKFMYSRVYGSKTKEDENER